MHAIGPRLMNKLGEMSLFLKERKKIKKIYKVQVERSDIAQYFLIQ